MTAPEELLLPARLAELIETYGVPGASVSVFADGQVTDVAAGVVNLRTGVEVRPDSPFMIQSITKVWTATLVMQLVDEGLVALDEPVVRYLPGFRTADPDASGAITVRHLLTHTGGFEGDIWAPTTSGDDALQVFVDEHVSQAPQHAPPGSFYSYCSAGMGVLGRLVEVMRDTTFSGALRRQLTDPLGVDGVAADAGEALGYRTAIGHVRSGPSEPLVPLPTWAVMPPSNPAAGNQLAMPARGLLDFARMHLADGIAPSGARVLSADSAQLMRSPQVRVPGNTGEAVHQGLGWMLTSSDRVAEHGGDAPGSGGFLFMVPDRGVAVAVLANGGDMSGLLTELYVDLLSQHAGVSSPPAAQPPPRESSTVDAERYCGRYEVRNRVAEVSTDPAGRLWLTTEDRNEAVTMLARAGMRPEKDVVELVPFEGETFLFLDQDGNAAGAVEFIGADEQGRPRYLHLGRALPRVDG